MQPKLRKTLAAGLIAGALAGAATTAGFAALLLAGSGVAAMRIDGRATLPSARAANPLLHSVLLKPAAVLPRSVSSGEKRNIEQVVRTQIRAYAAREADQAFAKLAPSTQRFFGKPDHFFRALAKEVPAMLDIRRFAFLGVERAPSRIVQQVLLTDSTGREWLAEFQLEQLTGGDWRIKGCVVQSTPGQQAHWSSGVWSDRV
jgi:hypothetical protein